MSVNTETNMTAKNFKEYQINPENSTIPIFLVFYKIVNERIRCLSLSSITHFMNMKYVTEGNFSEFYD